MLTRSRVLSLGNLTRPPHPAAQACVAGAPARRQTHVSREGRLRGGRGGPAVRHPLRLINSRKRWALRELPKLPASEDLAACAEAPEMASGHGCGLEHKGVDTRRFVSMP